MGDNRYSLGWKKARTPESMKPETEPTKIQPSKAWRHRHRGSKIRVEEPLMLMLDETMRLHGVSSVRLETFLGLSVDRLKAMRRYNSTWQIMTTVRQCFWAMGYDLEVRLVRVAKPDDELILSIREKEMRDIRKITGSKQPWDMTRLWQTLGFERLPDEEEKSD